MKRKNVLFTLAVTFCSLFISSCSFSGAGLTGTVRFHVDGKAIRENASFARSGDDDYEGLYMEISLLGDYNAKRNLLLSGNETVTFGSVPVGSKIHAYAKVYRKGGDAASGDFETVLYDGESEEITVACGKNELSLVLGSVTYYQVNAVDSEHGELIASAVSARPGAEVTVSVSSESGYRLKTLSVKDDGGNILNAVKVIEGAKYTFTMPSSNVTVSAEYALIDYSVVVPENIVFGELTSNTTSAKKGDTVTLTPKAGSGYVLASVSVKDSDGNPVATTPTGDIYYTFTMPASDVTVKAFFVRKFTESVETIDGETNRVCFGDWPQTIMPSDVTVDESITTERGGYTYCYGSDGYWYAKCIEKGYNSTYKYSDDTYVKSSVYDSTRYFRVEPVKWRVLNPDYDGDKLLLSEQILINCAYYDTEDVDRMIGSETVYPNNYEESRVRAFLNGLSYKVKETGDGDQTDNDEFSGKGFLNTAFTENAQGMIVMKEVDNTERSTNPFENETRWNGGENQYACNNIQDDRIFLLSELEATTTGYGFVECTTEAVARRIMTTDFAKANGAQQSTLDPSYGGYWWLRSPVHDYKYRVRRINHKGRASEYESVKTSSIGVVPALYVNF